MPEPISKAGLVHLSSACRTRCFLLR
jgi:hypothetical protein